MKVLVVYKKSVYEIYSSLGDEEVQAFLAQGGAEVERLRESHRRQTEALAQVLRELEKRRWSVRTCYRADLEPVTNYDLILSVGGDGTFLEVSHHVRDVPVMGINSDPERSRGLFTAGTAADLGHLLEEWERLPRFQLHRLELVIDGRVQPEPVLNDVLYAHANPAAVTRYRLQVDGRWTVWRSSGLLVATAAGSTGWIYEEGGEVLPLTERRLQYLSRGVRGAAPGLAKELKLVGLTRRGCLYVDGPHVVRPVRLGGEVIVRPGPPLTVVGDLEAKRRRYYGT